MVSITDRRIPIDEEIYENDKNSILSILVDSTSYCIDMLGEDENNYNDY